MYCCYWAFVTVNMYSLVTTTFTTPCKSLYCHFLCKWIILHIHSYLFKLCHIYILLEYLLYICLRLTDNLTDYIRTCWLIRQPLISFANTLYCLNWATFIVVLSRFPYWCRRLTLIQSRVYYLYSLQLLRVSLGNCTHRLVLTDYKIYGYIAHMLSRDTKVSTYSLLRNTVYTYTAYCTKLNKELMDGDCTITPHTRILFSIS